MMCRYLPGLLLFPFFLQAQDSLLTADEAVNIAIQNNLQIQIAKTDADIAKINNTWGNAGKWPTLGANIGYTRSIQNLDQELSNGSSIKRNGATNSNLNANLVFDWRIYNGFRVRATKYRLEELEKISEIDLRQQIALITYDVLIGYYNLVRLNQQVIATRAIIDVSRERFKIAETRFNVGSAAKTDMLQAGIDLNLQEVNLSDIQKQIEQTKAALNTILKRDATTGFEVADTSFVIESVNLGEVSRKIQTNNYDLLRARGNMALLLHDRRIINSQRLPVLSLSSLTSYNRTKANGGFFLSNQTYGPNLGLGLAIPIYTSNIFKTQLKVNEAEQKRQDLEIERLNNQLQLELQIAYQEYVNALNVVEIETGSVKLAEENNFIATERFRKLQGNSIELRQAQLSLIEAQNRLINAQFRAKLATTSILLLAGEL